MDTVAIKTKTWKYKGNSYEVELERGVDGYYTAYSNENGEWREYGKLKKLGYWHFDWVGFYTWDTDEEEGI
tara:strand:+ start:543 stop:755 length:213 start_codon:yes stop_codon:yes gene_type:complete